MSRTVIIHEPFRIKGREGTGVNLKNRDNTDIRRSCRDFNRPIFVLFPVL